MAYLYMVKLSRPLGTSRHQASLYLGSCLDLNQRMREHNAGIGAKMLKAAGEQGISYHLCRVLEVPTSQDARRLEAKYKRWKNNARVMNCRKLWQTK